MFIIKTKSPLFSESRAGVQFYNGRAETDDAAKAALLKELGYEVEEVKDEKSPAKKTAKKSGE